MKGFLQREKCKTVHFTSFTFYSENPKDTVQFTNHEMHELYWTDMN